MTTRRKPIPHGTKAGYTAGCRCEPCTAGNTAYHRQYRATRQTLGLVAHGTDLGYSGHGCRCMDCRTAHRDARRAERAAARERVTPQ